MNYYRVYSVIHPGAHELVQCESSFGARRNFAAKHQYELTDCVAIREWERTEPVIAPHALPGNAIED